MGFFASVIPTAGTNRVKNPSFEAAALTGTWTAQTGVTFAVSTDVSLALFGLQSGRFQTTTTNDTGVVGELDAALSAADTYLSFWVRGTQPSSWRIGLATSTSGTPASATTATAIETAGNHTRYGVMIAAATASGKDKIWIGLPAAGSHTTDCYIDGVQVEQSSTYTTYIDGDLGHGYEWMGQRSAYYSQRYAWYDHKPVSGGVVNELDDRVTVFLQGITGIGLPPVKNQAQASALGRGAMFQNTQINPRVVQLQIRIMGTSYVDLADQREALLAKLPIGQPFELRYTVGSVTLALMVVYEGGLNTQVQTGQGFSEVTTLALVAYDEPFWQLTYESRTALSLQTTTAANFANNLVRSAATGAWSLLDPVTYVYAYALGPDKTMWVGGVNGTYQVSKWTGGASFTNVASATGGSAAVYALAVSPDNSRVYAGGSFTNIGGVAATNIAYLVLSTGVWTALHASGVNGTVRAMQFDTDGNLWIGGLFTTAGATTVNGICKYNGSAFSAVQSGVSGSNQDVYCLAIAPNGDVYLGGDFTGASQCSTPSAPTVNGATTTGGLFSPADQRHYQVSALAGTGETMVSTQGNDTLGVGENSFTLTISAVTNATGYNIYRSDTGAAGTYAYIGTTTSTSFTDIGYALQNKTTAAAYLPYNTTGGRTTNVARFRPSDNAFYSVGAISAAGVGKGLTGGIVYTCAVGRDGVTCYWGGAFTRADDQDAGRVARYNGSVNVPMGTGMAGGDVKSLLVDTDGSLLAGGNFTSASGRTGAVNLARWVGGDEGGGEWVTTDIGSWPASMTVNALALRYRDVWLGSNNQTATGIVAYTGTLTYDGFEGRPMLVITGPSSSTMTMRYFELVGVGKLYLDLVVRASETVVIDLDEGTITSNYASGSYGSEQRTRAVLTGSTMSGLHLRNGANPYALLATGTVTAATCTLIDRTAYISSDT